MGRSRALANGVGKGSMKQQVRSKKRVADHGEVFTPGWMVDAMLDPVKEETERIDSRFLEPACGSGNFLVKILARKLAAVDFVYGKSDFERRHYALLALMIVKVGVRLPYGFRLSWRALSPHGRSNAASGGISRDRSRLLQAARRNSARRRGRRKDGRWRR